MKRIALSVFASACITTGTLAAAAETYTLDASHTRPTFEIGHMGLSTFRGQFYNTTGTFTLDRAAKTGSIDVTIDVKSVATGVDKLNEHLMTKDFFEVEKYPTMTFKAKSLKFKGDVPVQADGELTLHGVTKPVSLTIANVSCKEHPMRKKQACGADVSTSIKRSDFGMSYGIPNVGDEVKIRIGLEALAN